MTQGYTEQELDFIIRHNRIVNYVCAENTLHRMGLVAYVDKWPKRAGPNAPPPLHPGASLSYISFIKSGVRQMAKENFNRGDYVVMSGYEYQLGRVYKILPGEYQIAMFNAKDMGINGPRFDYGSLMRVAKADRLRKVDHKTWKPFL
jgi:hypothetical protein